MAISNDAGVVGLVTQSARRAAARKQLERGLAVVAFAYRDLKLDRQSERIYD